MRFSLLHRGQRGSSAQREDFDNFVKPVMLALSKGLQRLHESEIVHRDIKLESILLSTSSNSSDGEAKAQIPDFGSTEILEEDPAKPGLVNKDRLHKNIA